MRSLRLPVTLASTLVALALSFASASAQPVTCCILPDNGFGTAQMPPNCSVGYNGQGEIIDGLPPGSSILITAARLHSFTGVVSGPGGSLGGEQETWTATLDLTLQGTGVFAAYNRFVAMPIASGQTHSAPRTAFAPVQSFNTLLNLLQGQLPPGDPDFDLLRITAGNGFGMPSPGQTILTTQSGAWLVDSFFDITYRVDFIGKPASTFGGMSGSTTNVLERFTMCHEEPVPATPATWGAMKALYR